MPANARQTYKQELDRAINNLDWGIEHVRRMAIADEKDHEEVTQVCELAATGMMTCQELLNTLKRMI